MKKNFYKIYFLFIFISLNLHIFSQDTDTSTKKYEKKILFVIENSNSLYQIGIMDIDGKNKRILTNKGNNWCPTISPDGDKVAFYSDRTGYINLWLMNINGSFQTQLTLNKENINIIDLKNRGQISWSLDSDEIFFLKNKNICKIDRTGHSTTNVTNTNDITSFKLSPDGKKWLFSREKTKFHNGLWTMNYNGSGIIQITESNIFNPVFDWGFNNQIIYLQNREISMINYDGTNYRIITNIINLNNDIVWAKFDNNILQNNLIAYINNDGNIWLMSIDGKNQRQITTDIGDYPYWMDKETLLYTEKGDIYSININNSKKKRLTYYFKSYYPVVSEITVQNNIIISGQNDNE